jgi:hypothetical protein
LVFLTPGDVAGGWRKAFGAAASRLPTPNWLYAEDEQAAAVLGYPLKVGANWESLRREFAGLVEAEIRYRRSLALREQANKATLVDLRTSSIAKLAELFENAFVHDYGQRLPEILWLVLSREAAEQLHEAVLALSNKHPELSEAVADEIRYTVAQRVANVVHRGKSEGFDRARRAAATPPDAGSNALADLVRDDLMPFADRGMGAGLRELRSFLHGSLHLDAARFSSLLATAARDLSQMRKEDPSFDRVLASWDPEVPELAPDRMLFCEPVLNLLEIWNHPRKPRLSTEMNRLLVDLGQRCKRLEVIATLRDRIVPVTEKGAASVTQVGGRAVRLSRFTRPLDYFSPGVLPSAVRRYGLLYDLVEFTQLLEQLRRRGHTVEEQGIRLMVRFLALVDEIRDRRRLKFEKFLGDGAFYSARSARSILLAATEIRLLYEKLRKEGFPFDRGMRLAMNVGSYHLLPMLSATDGLVQFEFFGHGLIELARLTSGKTTRDVEDIADFLISSGYDVHTVLDFLGPVRHASRYPEHVRERPYAAFVAENGELVNLGGVVTEGFLRDLESEWPELGLAYGTVHGMRWLFLVPSGDGPWVGVRPLGTAKLKGLDPTPVAEVIVAESAPTGSTLLPPGSPLLQSMQRLSRATEELSETEVSPIAEVDSHLCVVGVIDEASDRCWYIGRFEDELDALAHAFRIRLSPVGLKDDEPFEPWLFQRRGELAKLYNGLRRDSAGATVPLDDLRAREGYFTCLLATPHRSPR